jgi:hypothetical protein
MVSLVFFLSFLVFGCFCFFLLDDFKAMWITLVNSSYKSEETRGLWLLGWELMNPALLGVTCGLELLNLQKREAVGFRECGKIKRTQLQLSTCTVLCQLLICPHIPTSAITCLCFDCEFRNE